VSVLTLMPTDTEMDVHVEQKQDLTGAIAAAVFDDTRTYRYLLTRIWDPSRKPMVVVMLNPSTADAFTDDPTIRRLAGEKGFARRERAGGLVVVNLFALRSTNPAALLRHPDPVGKYNDLFIRRATSLAGTVVAAWGAQGVQDGRGAAVAASLVQRRVPLSCLGMTATGQPRHPLYLPGVAPLQPYRLAS